MSANYNKTSATSEDSVDDDGEVLDGVVADEGGDDDVVSSAFQDNTSTPKKKRQKTSEVWQYYNVILTSSPNNKYDGMYYAQCKQCSCKYHNPSGTSTLKKHLIKIHGLSFGGSSEQGKVVQQATLTSDDITVAKKHNKGNKKAKVLSVSSGTTNKLCRLLRECQFEDVVTMIPNMMKSDLNQVDVHGDIAIHLAFSLEQYDIIKMLAHYGASLETRNSNGKTLFQLIASEHQKKDDMLSLSQYLLEHYYVNLTMRDDDDDYPAHIAFKYKRYDLVKLFIEKGGFSPNTLDINRLSILHKSLRIKQYDMIELCLEYGANRDLPDDNGYTPNHFFANVKDDKMIQLFNNK